MVKYPPIFFQSVLPNFSLQTIISVSESYNNKGGEIFLPFTSYFCWQLLTNLNTLCKCYIISFIYNINEIPLCEVTRYFKAKTEYQQLIPVSNIKDQQRYLGITKKTIKQTYTHSNNSGCDWDGFFPMFQNLIP